MPASSEKSNHDRRPIIRSGVALLDDWLAGVREGGVHLITGGTGSGKSTIALNFAHSALARGERVAMLVTASPDDTRGHAAHLGIDIEGPLYSGRLLLLRYRDTFALSAGHSLSSEQVVGDLERLLMPHRPTRIVVDGLAPFVSGALPVVSAVAALASLLTRSGATSLLTFPEALSGQYDRSLEPLVQSAAAIVHLVAEPAGVRRAEVSNVRYGSPAQATARFRIHERPTTQIDAVRTPIRI